MSLYQWEYKNLLHWVCSCCLAASVMSNSVQPPHGLQPARLLCPCDSPGKNTRVGCHALLQGILLTNGSNLGLLHYRQILYLWATREAHIGFNLLKFKSTILPSEKDISAQVLFFFPYIFQLLFPVLHFLVCSWLKTKINLEIPTSYYLSTLSKTHLYKQ